LAREARADEEKERVARAAADLGARGAAQLAAQARVEMAQVDAAVDHVQLLRRDAKAAADLVRDHARVADHGAQARMLEELPLGGADVAVVRIERDAEALEEARRPRPQLQPAPVHAVARAIDVAAGNTLVRLHEIEALAAPGGAGRARKGPIAPDVAEVKRIYAQHAPRAPALGLARDQRHVGAGALECGQRARDETLGAAVGGVALAHDGELQL